MNGFKRTLVNPEILAGPISRGGIPAVSEDYATDIKKNCLHWDSLVLLQEGYSLCRSDLLNLKTKEDRTIYFDFMQFEVGKIRGLTPKFNLYTVPGQDIYTVSRKIILNGVDGIIYVADSSKSRMRDNLFTLIDLVKNLRANKHQVEDFPIIFQYNKRDLPDALPIPYLHKTLNRFGAPEFEASAINGEGVFECLKASIELIVNRVTRILNSGEQPDSAVQKS